MSQENNTKPVEAKKTLYSGVTKLLILGLLDECGICTGTFIRQEIIKRSNGFVAPRPPSIVNLLQKLQEDGFAVSNYMARTHGTKGRAWRQFEITDLGRQELAKEKEMWMRFEDCVHTIICFD